MVEPILVFQNVSKSYRSDWTFRVRPVLQDISFAIDPGESVGFIGHNGAGKSTTMRIALGLQRPSTGTVLLNGMSPTIPAARIGVAYVPENPLLYDNITPEQWLEFARRFSASEPRQRPTDVLACLERFGLMDYRRVPVRQLSKGLAQRMAIAAAFFTSPRLMILDEPMTGLDPVARRTLTEALAEYRRNGGAVFFSSHALLELDRLSDRFISIRNGRLCASSTWGDLLRDASPDEGFVVEVESRQELVGFERLSTTRWKRAVPTSELSALIERLSAAQGVRILEITRANDRELAYLSLIAREG